MYTLLGADGRPYSSESRGTLGGTVLNVTTIAGPKMSPLPRPQSIRRARPAMARRRPTKTP